MSSRYSRRRLLRASSGLVIAAGFAGCSGGGDGTDTEESTETDTATTTPTGTATLELPDGSTRCLDAIEGQQPISEYYGFGKGESRSASTPDELAVDDATVSFLYRSTSSSDLHLVVIHGDPEATSDRGGGTAVLGFDGVAGAEWQVQDGPPGNDAYATANGALGASESAIWSWPDDRSDGGAIGPLDDGFSVTITHRGRGSVSGTTAERDGLARWLFIDGSEPDSPIEVTSLGGDAGDVAASVSAGCR